MKRKKRIILFLSVIILLLLVGFFLGKESLQINVEQIKELILSFGIFGPLVFIMVNVITIVVSPLTSFPLWPVSLAIWGYWPTCFFVLLGNSMGSIVNFWIARRFGRPVVTKLVGEKGMKKIDDITKIVGLKTLFIARLFSGAASDYISYAAGLTMIKFKPYFFISILVTIPMIFFNLYVLNQALMVDPIWIVLLGISGYALAVIFPLVIYKYRKNQK